MAAAAAATAAGLGGGGGGRGGGGGPFGSRRPPDMEDVIRKGQERLKNLIPGGFGSYKGIVLVILAGVVIWLVTGFFRVQPNQQAIQLVFGKPYGKPVEPGLHYNLPSPIGNVVVVNVQDQRRVVIGSRGGQDRYHHPLHARPAADLDREPDADRRREHRRHRVCRAVADQGRLQVRLRRA